MFFSEMSFIQNSLMNGEKSHFEMVQEALEEENTYSQGNAERS